MGGYTDAIQSYEYRIKILKALREGKPVKCRPSREPIGGWVRPWHKFDEDKDGLDWTLYEYEVGEVPKRYSEVHLWLVGRVDTYVNGVGTCFTVEEVCGGHAQAKEIVKDKVDNDETQGRNWFYMPVNTFVPVT